MNTEKTAELINMELAAKEIEQIQDLSLNQFLNNGVYVAFNKYSEAIKENKLSSDFDLKFFIEILKGMFSNKAFLQGILEGKDYRWFDDDETQPEKQKETVLDIGEQENLESLQKGESYLRSFIDHFTNKNFGLAKQELKKAIRENEAFVAIANNTLLVTLDKAISLGQFEVFDQVVEVFRFLNLEVPNYFLGKNNLASLLLNHGGVLGSQKQFEQCVTLQKLACVICPTKEVKEVADHNIAVCYTELGKMAHLTANYGLALQHMLAACTHKPSESTKYNVGVAASDLATHMLKNKYPQGAIDNFLIALDAGLVLPEILNDLGVAFASLNNFDEAIIYFEKALEIDPKAELARKNLIKAKNDKKAEELNLSGFLIPKFQQMEFQQLEQAA